MNDDTAKGRVIQDILELEKLEEISRNKYYTKMIRKLLNHRKTLYGSSKNIDRKSVKKKS